MKKKKRRPSPSELNSKVIRVDIDTYVLLNRLSQKLDLTIAEALNLLLKQVKLPHLSVKLVPSVFVKPVQAVSVKPRVAVNQIKAEVLNEPEIVSRNARGVARYVEAGSYRN